MDELQSQAFEIDDGAAASSLLRLRLRQMRWFLFSFRGRISRLQFLSGGLCIYGVPLLAIFLITSLPDSGILTIAQPVQGSTLGGPISDVAKFVGLVVAGVLFVWINWAITLKRFHDFDRSFGTMILAGLLSAIPYIGWIPILVPVVVSGTPGWNQYGSGPGWRHAQQ